MYFILCTVFVLIEYVLFVFWAFGDCGIYYDKDKQ